MNSFAPTGMSCAVGMTNEATLLTLNEPLLWLGRYLSSPVYVRFTGYTPLGMRGMSTVPFPPVTFT